MGRVFTRKEPRKERTDSQQKCGIQQLVNARHITTIEPQPAIGTYAVPLLSTEPPQFIDPRDHKNAWRDPLRASGRNVGYRTQRFPVLTDGISRSRKGWCSSTRERCIRAGHNQVHRMRNFFHVQERYCLHINLVG